MELNRNELIALRSGRKQALQSGKYWSKDDIEKLNQLYEDGYGISELAMIFDRNEVSIYQQISKSGLLAPQCKPRNRQTKIVDEAQCLCPVCAVMSCQNCGKECTYAGSIR